MKAPQSKTAQKFLTDPGKSREYFIAKRKAIREGKSSIELDGIKYLVLSSDTGQPSAQSNGLSAIL